MRRVWSLCMCVVLAACAPKKPAPGEPAAPADVLDEKKAPPSFAQARASFQTKVRAPANRRQEPAPPAAPSGSPFELVQYPTKLGPMHAYVSRAPEGGGKHPIVIWRFGGFSNGSYPPAAPGKRGNDQTAIQYQRAGLLMM